MTLGPSQPSQLELGCQGCAGNLTGALGWGSPALWGHSLYFFHVALSIPGIASPDNFLLPLLPGNCLWGWCSTYNFCGEHRDREHSWQRQGEAGVAPKPFLSREFLPGPKSSPASAGSGDSALQRPEMFFCLAHQSQQELCLSPDSSGVIRDGSQRRRRFLTHSVPMTSQTGCVLLVCTWFVPVFGGDVRGIIEL